MQHQQQLSEASLLNIRRLAALIRSDAFVLFITGAGVSVASGIPAYRTGGDGLWNNFLLEWGTRRKFMEDPKSWWNDFWAKSHNMQAFGTAVPNAAHVAIAQIMRTHRSVRLATQNIDRLHWKAGVDADRLVESHGAVGLFRCTNPRCIYHIERVLDDVPLLKDDAGKLMPPLCPSCSALLLPLTLLFDETYTVHPLFRHATLSDWIDRADALVFAGTSFSVGVTTAAIEAAMLWGIDVFNFNIEPQRPPGASIAAPILNVVGPCEETLPLLAHECEDAEQQQQQQQQTVASAAVAFASRTISTLSSIPAALLAASPPPACSLM